MKQLDKIVDILYSMAATSTCLQNIFLLNVHLVVSFSSNFLKMACWQFYARLFCENDINRLLNRNIRSLLNYVPYLLSCPTCPRASRTSCPTCSCALRASCPMCSRALRASCSTCPRASRAWCPTCSRALRALLPHLPRALRALLPYMPRALRALVPCMPRALRALVPYVLSCPTYLVSYVASCLVLYEPFFLTYTIASITLKRRSVFINNMDIFELFETKYKNIYIRNCKLYWYR